MEDSELVVPDSDSSIGSSSNGDGDWTTRSIKPTPLSADDAPKIHDPWGSQEWDSLFIPATNFPRANTGVYPSASLTLTSILPDNGHAFARGGQTEESNPTLSMRRAGQQSADSLYLPPGMFRSEGPSDLESSMSSATLTAALGSQSLGPPQLGPQSTFIGPLVSGSLTAQDLMTKSLALTASGLPAAQEPGQTPFYTELFPDATVNKVRKAMRAKPFFLERLFREHQKARDMQTSAWQEGTTVPGTFVRGLRFVMNLPNDLPAAVARLVKVPESSRVTVVVRLKESPEEVVMLYQTCTHDAPYGDNFRVQDTLSFSLDASGKGVRLSRWVEVAWVKDLPWGLGMIKGAVESSVKSKSAESQPEFVKLLLEAMQGT